MISAVPDEDVRASNPTVSPLRRRAPRSRAKPPAPTSTRRARGRLPLTDAGAPACPPAAQTVVVDDDEEEEEFDKQAFGGGVSRGTAGSSSVVASSLLCDDSRRRVQRLTRRMPDGYMDDAVDLGALNESMALKYVFRHLESLPEGTRCTAGIAGTDGNVNGGPAIMRGRVSPNSTTYSAAAGWDASWTHALVFGLNTLSDEKVRQLEIAITAKINALPNLTSVAESGAGQGPYTQGPMRVVYLNRLVPGASLNAARAAASTAKCAPGEKRKCDKCGAQRGQRGPCPGQQCADERRAAKKCARK